LTDKRHPQPTPLRARLADDADWTAAGADISKVGKPLKRFSWLSPRTLWRSRNNVLASISGDPTERARGAWTLQQRELLIARGEREVARDFTLRRDDLSEFEFIVMGDTGEGDNSQYRVVPSLLSVLRDAEFAVIASDVVYPAGDVNEYVEKFFVPYAQFDKPIYAIPGNHDWLDGLAGFMRHFCDAEPPAEKLLPPRGERFAGVLELVHRSLWRRPRDLAPGTLRAADELRGAARSRGPRQPNMYFAIDTPNLRIIAIDAGILGRLDFEQGQWLRRVAAGDKPKLLISGKPVYAGPGMSPRRILGADGKGSVGTIWSVVSDPANNFVGMIAGDVHHYERHAVRLGDGRTMQCVISGGGGAFMTSTHQLGKVDMPEVGEEDWVVFPTRADSLRAYSISLQRRLRIAPRGIPADEAAAIVAERHGLDPAFELSRGEGAAEFPPTVSRRSRRLANVVFPHGWRAQEKISELLDWDDPPYFKNFVRVVVDAGGVELIAYGVTGLERDVDDPPVIDRVRIDL
jgi:hypothetical protein